MHACASTLHLMVFQGHTNGHIKVEVEEGGSKHTTLPDTAGDGKAFGRLPICPDSSCWVLM